MQFRVGEHPQLMFTWGANVPDKVKVQKVIRLWPLKFKIRFDYDSHTRSTTFGTSCKVSSSSLCFLSSLPEDVYDLADVLTFAQKNLHLKMIVSFYLIEMLPASLSSRSDIELKHTLYIPSSLMSRSLFLAAESDGIHKDWTTGKTSAIPDIIKVRASVQNQN